jgi:pimeloyl-ACP methyl ester carboxylesterase
MNKAEFTSFFPQMSERSLPCIASNGFYRLAYIDWQNTSSKRPIICVHGLTRNGRDFDYLAKELSKHRRVVCPDLPGRGKSSWLARPDDYGMPTYVNAIVSLLARMGCDEVDWVGTSMGGIIGMLVAALPGTPIRKLVLNDIGPAINADGLTRLSHYVGCDPSFETLDTLEAYLRQIAASYGPLTAAEWRHLAQHSARKRPDNTLGLAYDPQIAAPLRKTEWKAVPMWEKWDLITAPTLVLRGAESDILNQATANEMSQRGPHAKIVELAGIGHAPALMSEDQIAVVRDFLCE